ncbi:MAG: hypothetical protein FWH27_13835, partial [Planctomycetaceae bacterium]|nr:hypothetical protein [Planctomycetaceae bacterium]
MLSSQNRDGYGAIELKKPLDNSRGSDLKHSAFCISFVVKKVQEYPRQVLEYPRRGPEYSRQVLEYPRPAPQ